MGKSVLFVESFAFMAKEIIAALESCGLEVESFDSAGAALEFVRSLSEPPDIVISDCYLMHGSEFRQEETEFGLKAGLALFGEVRKVFPVLPVLIINATHDAICCFKETDKNLAIINGSAWKDLEGFLGMFLRPAEPADLAA